MGHPIIGLSCYIENARWGAWSTRAAIIQTAYIEKIQNSGGVVVVIPPGIHSTRTIERVDALVLAGGADVDPERYGAEALETTDRPRTDRDESEISLYLAARTRGIPVLGICRGLQIMTVAHGGTLHQHLPAISPNTTHRDSETIFSHHFAHFAQGSLINKLTGVEQVRVNSAHHQAVDSPGDLLVTGWAEDHTVEVCEDPSHAFVLGVQWHPEQSDNPQISDQLFSGLIRAC